ncbi:MAG: hypothetical protein M3081_12740, partial [Gemmatimonadota bacterium]|nr:hypothetical protein [Gemmatimonadota bacterium]
NSRSGGTPTVRVDATATGVQLRGDAVQTATLEAGRGREVRFPFTATPGTLPSDSVTFQFRATSGANADAVRLRIPVKPDYHPTAYTIAGTLRDTATTEWVLPSDLDPARSTLELSLGASPLAVVRGAYSLFHIYPYYCTEQVTSAGEPIIALWRAQKDLGTIKITGNPQREIETAVAMLSRRQRTDGGIGYWGASDWTTPWLSAYAGGLLLDAKSMGVIVGDSVLPRLAEYLSHEMHNATPVLSPVANYYDRRATRLADEVASVDFLSRYGKPDVAVENRLIASAAQMSQEDRIRLAEIVSRRGAKQAALALISPSWAAVVLEGRRAVLPDSSRFYFYSRMRPMARLLSATIAINPTHPLVAPMVETLVQQGGLNRGPRYLWNTQDLASVVGALADYEHFRKTTGDPTLTVKAAGKTLLQTAGKGDGSPRDSIVSLANLVTTRADGAKSLRLSLASTSGNNAGGYYFLTVHAVPLRHPVTPIDSGIVVERWYEKYDLKTPITSVAEGELVRVRLRITIPHDREFFVLDDALPAGLEAVDLSLRTAAPLPGPGRVQEGEGEEPSDSTSSMYGRWFYGSWDSGWWSPFDHRELRDDRVVYYATFLWKGTYTATYVARATTPGVFTRPPAHAEEMYNPAVFGRTDGGVFTVTAKTKP